jgi:hypothetical protein
VADQKKNDVADALAALAGGGVPSETESPSGGIPSETTVFSPPAPEQPIISPAAAPLAAKRPTAPQSTQASTPSASASRSPVVTGSPSLPDSRTKPNRTGASPSLLPKDLPLPSAIPPPARIRPANPDGSPSKARPAMPERAVVATAPVPEPTRIEEVPETTPELIEDEETIAAAPDASAFAPRRAANKPAHTPIYASLFFRRTMIPILLTCGVMLPAIGLWSMFDQNAPLAAIGKGVEMMLIAIGVVLLALGFINALHVKHVLESAGKRKSS